jgi:hypothetical protein
MNKCIIGLLLLNFYLIGNAQIIETVNIGKQVWATQNLNVSNYRNGDPIPKVEDDSTWASLTTGAFCYYNNDSASYASIYGKLYNWYAVHDARGLAPVGYHIPKDAEWARLKKTLGENAGTQMKATSGWSDSGNGTNSVGFAGLPGGFRKLDGTFFHIGSFGYWWSSTAFSTSNAWYRSLCNEFSVVYRSNINKASGFSVRCLRD